MHCENIKQSNPAVRTQVIVSDACQLALGEDIQYHNICFKGASCYECWDLGTCDYIRLGKEVL